MNDPTEKITDLNYLSALAKGNKEFIKEMISIFLTDTPVELRSLETGIADQNFETIRSVAHKLKSTLPYVGIDKIIGKEVLEIETMAAGKSDMAGITARFEKVKEVCDRACSELEETPIQ
jgi:HPt (histidine-containing phosphotransfer) domain-containing protein